MGELKEEEERQKDVGFMRQVLRRGGRVGGDSNISPLTQPPPQTRLKPGTQTLTLWAGD